MAKQRVEVKNPVGVNKSLNPADLPPNVWSDVMNVSFKDGKAQKASGYDPVFGEVPSDITYLASAIVAGSLYWYEGTPTGIYRTDGSGLHADLTRTSGPYTGTIEDGWTGGNLNTVSIMNNGFDAPQALLYGANNFVDLPNWPADYRCKVMRVYKNYLFAMNISKSGTEEPTTVKWSSPADPGEVPFTWDVADFSNDAGEYPLADTHGAIVDARKLRDSFIIYKEDSVYSVNYIGGTYVFQFRKLFDDIGALAVDCMAEFDGKHFVVGQGDVYVHNGVAKQSVITGKMREYLFSQIATDAYKMTRVVPDYGSTEMWVCFSSPDNSVPMSCDKALVWNWAENTWSVRELPQIRYATYGIVDPQEPDWWDEAKGQWDTDALSWGEFSYNPSRLKVIMASPSKDKVYLVGNSTVFDDEVFISTLEKTDITFGDDRKMKTITSITPHVRGLGEMNIYVGSAYVQNGPITWRGPFKFQVGSEQFKVDCRVSGRYIALKFVTESLADWRLNGYTFELTEVTGDR